MAQVPKVRKAFCFDPNTKKSNWQDIPIPDLPENFILVKVVSTSVHPLDFVFLSGAPFAGFGVGPGPHVLGTEGAGIVVAHGPGKGHAFLNKRVCMMPSRPGVWTDYAIVHINDCIIVSDATPWEAACSSMVLPLTALMFLAMAKRMNQKAIINSAANSCAGRLINRLLQANGIEVINLVRKADKAAQIAAEGARYILNTTDPDFEKKFVELCMKLQAGLVLECVGGEFLTKIAALAPPGSTICTYGSISGSPVSTISNGDLFQGKSLIGAAVFHYWSTLHSEDKVKQVDAINQQLGTTFKIPVLKTFPFAKIEDALRAYEENKKSGTTADGKFVCMW